MLRNILLMMLPLAIIAINLGQNSNQIVISPDDPYWTDECRRDTIPQSPINLKPPFTFMDFVAEFNFHAQIGGQVLNDGGFNLKMDGDFGNFKYNNMIFNSYELSFKAPSEHTFGPQNQRFALEMQIASISPEGIRIMIAIMFSRSDENGEFLANFGFGDGLLQHLTTNQYYEVKKPIDISDVIPTDNKFFIYEGTRTTPPCEPALWFIAYQTYKVSDAQLNDFPKQLLYKDRAITVDQREVYSTFDPKKDSASTTTKNTDQTSTKTEEVTSTNAKSQNVDSFEIVGDDTPYGDEIYPALKDIPNPRPLKNEDYIVVTSSGDPRPYLDFLKLNKDKVNSLLNELEDEKVTKNMKKAKRDFDALEATGLVNKTGPIEGQADMEKLDDVLKDLSLTGTDAECTIADTMPKAVKDQMEENAAEAANTADTTNTVSTTSTATPKNSVKTTNTTGTTHPQNTIDTENTRVNSNSTANTTITNPQNTPNTEKENITDNPNIANSESTTNPTSTTNAVDNIEIETEVNAEGTALLTVSQNTDLKSQKKTSQTANSVEAPVEKVVSAIHHPDNRDPSVFFSELHKKPVVKANNMREFAPFSFLKLNSNTKNDLRNSIKKNILLDTSHFEGLGESGQDIRNQDLQNGINSNSQGSFNQRLEILENLLSKNTNADQSTLSGPDQGLEGSIVSENSRTNLRGAKSVLSETGTENVQTGNESSQGSSQTIFGPEISDNVKNESNSQTGGGVLAYNKEKKWDGFNIQNTSEWPELCKIGQSQSPINIDFSSKFKIESNKVKFTYEKPTNSYCELKNDGSKIVLYGSFGSAKYGDHPFNAEEIHFHYPSEHTFGDDMERTDMELQVIHRDSYGLVTVMSFFLKASDDGSTNSFLSGLGFTNNGLADNLQSGNSYYIESSKIDLSKLVEGASEYIRYEGSLTSPPCSENINWFLFNKRIQVGKESVEKFKKVLGQDSNIRGVQQINDRDLYIF